MQEKLKQMLKKWAEGEFKGDPQLNLIPSLYGALKRDGVDFSNTEQVGRRDFFFLKHDFSHKKSFFFVFISVCPVFFLLQQCAKGIVAS